MINSNEIKLTNEVIDIMEWIEKKDSNGESILFKDFFPIMINKRHILRPETDRHIDVNHYFFFRPLKNQKHVQFLIDYLFDNNPELKELKVFTNNKEYYNGKYSGKLIDNNGETVIELTNYFTEIELKFSIFYYFYNEIEVKNELKEIKMFNIKNKELQEDTKKKKAKKNNKK